MKKIVTVKGQFDIFESETDGEPSGHVGYVANVAVWEDPLGASIDGNTETITLDGGEVLYNVRDKSKNMDHFQARLDALVGPGQWAFGYLNHVVGMAIKEVLEA